MQFHAIHIQGNILSAELLDQIQNDQQGVGQAPKDFWLEPGTKVRDEIQRAWADVKDQYQIFNRRLEKLKDGDTGRADTRKYWMLDFFDYLGYKLETAPDETLNGKTYRISHRAGNLDGLPLHIAGVRESLDKKPDGRGSMSPHALVQEYLNVTEHVYGLVTNGAQLRLLRDSSRLTRLSYLEFDLTKILEEDRYADFALLYRLLHASRMPRTAADAPSSLIERYHTDSLEKGSAIRKKLSKSVKQAIQEFAHGFIKHPGNDHLRKDIVEGRLSAENVYNELLRLIYRLLFLMVTEERNLIYPESEDNIQIDPKEVARRQIYYKYYSVNRLRQLAEKRLFDQQRYDDLWRGLLQSFKLFESERFGLPLGIQPLAGDLFSAQALKNLTGSQINNDSLLRAIYCLSAFENDQRQIIRVNYAALDVEEFGSVYEGLLEYKPTIDQQNWQFSLPEDEQSERSSSGSHYTPDELVHPLIKHSLDYLIEDRLKQDPGGESLLTLKVADVACGSGHILLAAARRIALKLAQARTQEDQPAPAPYRRALREVVQHCIYGVDKNPLAVELCKVALWLEAHNPGQPLNFLDHRIRCGDAIVGVGRAEDLDKGIPDEAFKTLPGDDKEVAARLRKANTAARKGMEQLRKANQTELLQRLSALGADWKSLDTLEENTVQAVEAKRRHYESLRKGAQWWRLKQLADMATAQFFIPKTPENELFLSTEKDFREYSSGRKALKTQAAAKAVSVSTERRFFHWFLEFPEVMAQGGFDCVVGNPPYVAGRDIKQKIGELGQNYILSQYLPNEGRSDLVAYFFRRIGMILNNSGVFSLVTTKTISQGDTRITSLDYLVNNGYIISFAHRNIDWSGEAGVTVTLLSLSRPHLELPIYLNNKRVTAISTRLEENNNVPELEANMLFNNTDLIFQGSTIYGEGFKISHKKADEILALDKKYKNVIMPFLTGDHINENINCIPGEVVINFHDWPIERAKEYDLCFQIVQLNVKPERERKGDKATKEKWWIYMRNRIDSYRKISKRPFVLVAPIVSKYLSFVRFEPNIVFSNKTIIVDIQDHRECVLYSSIYSSWVYKYSTTLGSITLNFSIDDCFKKYPFPQNHPPAQEQKLEQIGETYHEHRRQLMLGMQLGLTKTYNLFHARALPAPEQAGAVAALPPAAIEKQYGKETAHLVKHLAANKEVTYTLEQALAGIHRLRALHVEMDQAVLEAYGWSDIALRHDFYEVDYLPENDRVRYTIHPEARREVLKRLLELNHRVYAEEVARGLHDKGKKRVATADAPESEGVHYPGEQGKMFEEGKQGKLF